jgi:hypothetical protein
MVDAAVELIRNEQGADAPTAPPCAEGNPPADKEAPPGA